jgi:hypothetical protein
MPIPQSGERGSPFTEIRHGWPAIIIAAATLVPSDTCTGLPFTLMEKLSLIVNISPATDLCLQPKNLLWGAGVIECNLVYNSFLSASSARVEIFPVR